MSGNLSVKVTEPQDLDLICDVQFAELFTSEALNRKFFGVMTRGVYSGYNHEITRSFEITIGADGKRNTAVVDKKGISLTVQCKKPIKVTIPKGRKSYCVIDAFYEIGTTTKQVDPTSTVNPAQIKVIPTYELSPEHTILFTADVPATADRVTESMISISERTIPEHYQRILDLTVEFDKKLADLRLWTNHGLDNGSDAATAKIRSLNNALDDMKRTFESKIKQLARANEDLSTDKYDKQGGILSGDITFTKDNKIQWLRNTDGCFIKFNSINNYDNSSCMEFGTTDDGVEGFKWTISSVEFMRLFNDGLHISKEIYANDNRVYHESFKPIGVLSGTISNGQTIPIPDGFSREQCQYIVSLNDSGTRAWDVDENGTYNQYRTRCSVNQSTGVVTAVRNVVNHGSGDVETGCRANYMVIATR